MGYKHLKAPQLKNNLIKYYEIDNIIVLIFINIYLYILKHTYKLSFIFFIFFLFFS